VSVIGIDQSLRATGLCINNVTEGRLTGLVLEEKKLVGAARLSSLRRRIMDTVRAYMPILIAVEGYSYDSTNRLAALGELGGIIRVELQDLQIPLIVVSPLTLKQFVTGSGAASKKKVIKFVKERYGYETDNDNIADAVGLAKFAEIYITRTSQYRSELSVMKKFVTKKKPKKRYKKVFSL